MESSTTFLKIFPGRDVWSVRGTNLVFFLYYFLLKSLTFLFINFCVCEEMKWCTLYWGAGLDSVLF